MAISTNADLAAIEAQIAERNRAAFNGSVTFKAVLAQHKNIDGHDAVFERTLAEPGDGYDEQALPMFVVRFADGTRLHVSEEELSTLNPAVEAAIAGACDYFSAARQLGYDGPHDLRNEAPLEIKDLFALALRKLSATRREVQGRAPVRASLDWVMQRISTLEVATFHEPVALNDGRVGTGMVASSKEGKPVFAVEMAGTDGRRLVDLTDLAADQTAPVEQCLAACMYVDGVAKRHGHGDWTRMLMQSDGADNRAMVDQLAVWPNNRTDAGVWLAHGNPHATNSGHGPAPSRGTGVAEANTPELLANIPLKSAFMAVFTLLCERDYPEILRRGGYDDRDRDDLCMDFDNAIGETLQQLDVAEPEGDSLDWKGTLHEWIEETYPHLGEAFEIDDEEPEGMSP